MRLFDKIKSYYANSKGHNARQDWQRPMLRSCDLTEFNLIFVRINYCSELRCILWTKISSFGNLVTKMLPPKKDYKPVSLLSTCCQILYEYWDNQPQTNLLVNKTDLHALYLSGTYCHKTGTRPPQLYFFLNIASFYGLYSSLHILQVVQ